MPDSAALNKDAKAGKAHRALTDQGGKSGLNELYFPGTFGTSLDYIKATAWGFGTKWALELAYAAINRVEGAVD